MHTQTAAMFIITDGYVCIVFFLIDCSYVQYSTDGVIMNSQLTTGGVQCQININVYFVTVTFPDFFV